MMSPIDSSAIILTSTKDLSSAPTQLNKCATVDTVHSSILAIVGIPNALFEFLLVVPLVFLNSHSSSFDSTARL